MVEPWAEDSDHIKALVKDLNSVSIPHTKGNVRAELDEVSFETENSRGSTLLQGKG